MVMPRGLGARPGLHGVNVQLPLGLRWPNDQRFGNFVAADNTLVVESLRRTASGEELSWLFLAGAIASGKTHLLLATCAAAIEAGRGAQYLGLAKLPSPRADAIRGCGGSDVLAIDDIAAIAGDGAAEHALFDLYNRCKAERASLIFASGGAPASLGIRMPDLVSRLSACTQLVLRPLDEASRRGALRDRAATRGIELDDAALDWLFARQARDLGSLTRLLDRIDRASLAAKRRVTVPFLRELLADSATDDASR